MTKKDEYISKIKSQLDDMNTQLDKLAVRSKSAEKAVQVKYKQQIVDLRTQANKANDKLDELKTTGEDSWHAMVAEMDKVGKALKHSYNYFKSQI